MLVGGRGLQEGFEVDGLAHEEEPMDAEEDVVDDEDDVASWDVVLFIMPQGLGVGTDR